MASRSWSLVSVVAGVLFSIFLFLFGLVLLADSRGNPLLFWVLEIVALVAVWVTVSYGVRFDRGAKTE